ncbi:MAG: putative surface protein with fasciclin (FAS1) repeats [Patiriisocius sp.]|jgi:uncharacterized surface protein with fasciclin (FAS1) repeats
MNTKILFTALFCFAVAIASAQKYSKVYTTTVTKDYKGSTFSSGNSIADNISGNTSFTYLSQILASEPLQAELANEEMITIFTPNDGAFNALEEEEREAFLSDKERVAQLVKSHTVPGRLDVKAIKKAIEVNNGTASFRTLAGTKLNATMNGETIILSDAEGNKAKIMDTDFYHKNGFFHVIEGIAFSTKTVDKQ